MDRTRITCALALAFVSVQAQAQTQAQANDKKWAPYVDTEAKIGSKRSLGEAGLFMPLAQNADTLLFADVRARFDSGSGREGNLGLGVRHMLGNGWNLGAYGYADRRRSAETGNMFNQSTFGAEALGRDFDLRANVYTPFGTRVRDLGSTPGGGTSAALVGNTVMITTNGGTTREERALKGYDAEAGWRVPFWDAEERRQFRVFLGGYRFSDAGINVAGPRARAEFVLAEIPQLWKGSRLTIGAETQHDSPRGTQSFVSIRLRIPLGGEVRTASLNAQERRMAEPVMRDVDIVSQSRSYQTRPNTVETATLAGNGGAVTVLSSSTTTGAALPGAVAAAGANSTVVLTGGYNTTGAITLAAGQTLMGAGTLTVMSASGTTATWVAPGGSLTASSSPINGGVVVQLGNNSTLSGLTITNNFVGSGSNAFSVVGSNVTGATVTNNAVTANVAPFPGGGIAAAVGVLLENNTNSIIKGNTLVMTGSFGTLGMIINNSTGILVKDNSVSASITTNPAFSVNSSNIAAGSTANTIVSGTCSFNSSSGAIGLTGGGACQ